MLSLAPTILTRIIHAMSFYNNRHLAIKFKRSFHENAKPL